MRGKVSAAGDVTGVKRITPAYAGKRSNFLSASFGMGDHPRLCGEKSTEDTSDATNEGSPPPMRGKDKEWAKQGLLTRITPAYAGKRHLLNHSQADSQDHPRLCGEKLRIADHRRK